MPSWRGFGGQSVEVGCGSTVDVMSLPMMVYGSVLGVFVQVVAAGGWDDADGARVGHGPSATPTQYEKSAKKF